MSYSLLEDYADVEIQVKTNNPERKYKKKLRKLKAQYDKNPSPELSIKISDIEKILSDLNKPKTVVKKKIKMKVKKVDKSLKYVNKKIKLEEKRREREENRREREDTHCSNWKVDKLKNITNNLKKNQCIIKGVYLNKLAKTCGFNTHYIHNIQAIHLYFENPNEEVYNYLMEKYSLTGLKNIHKTMCKTFNKLPMDIIKLIWKFYYSSVDFKIGVLINEFNEKMNGEKRIYNMIKKLYDI